MKRALVQQGRLWWTALTLLTRLPAPRLAGFQEEWLAQSVPYFPLVGLLVGALAAGVYSLASVLWRGPAAAVLALAAAAWVTGALHEDGWADVFDGFAGSRQPERILEIFKDPRIGAAGASALVFLLLAKLAGVLALPAPQVAASLVAAHVLSRWSSLPLLWRLPYARPAGGTAKPLAGRVTGRVLAAGTVVALLIVLPVLRWAALPALGTAAVSAGAAGLFFHRRLGGITGDCLGAANQLVELAVILALAVRWQPPS